MIKPRINRKTLHGVAWPVLSAWLVLLAAAGGGCGRSASDEPPVAAWAQPFPRSKTTSLTCSRCHQAEYDDWRQSHHARANRDVIPQADAPAFQGQTTETWAARFDFTTDGDGWPVIRETLKKSGEVREYRPSMRLACDPLVQYLVEIEPGRFQATDVAWDVHKHEWFSVYGDEERNPGEWGHWLGRGMNWNSMCARCHTTAFAKNYDPQTDRYASNWTEHGVSCIQCHHVMPGHEPGGDALARVDNITWDRSRAMETCAGCHTRADSLTPAFVPGEKYDDHYRLQLIDEPTMYFPDGQILEEVFVWGSFRHSKMHAAGVTCMDCHNPHTGQLLLPQENNAICMQCHTAPGRNNAPPIDPVAHSFHAEGSTGNRCVECHMRERTYMQRDPRRDHGFIIPDPVLTRELGVPNSCNECHRDQSVDWAIEHYEKWYGEKMDGSRHRRRARAMHAGFQGDTAAVAELLQLIETEPVSTWRASMLNVADRLAHADPRVLAIARKLIKDVDPVVRAAAVRALGTDPASRPLVRKALEDPVRLVRIDAAWALSRELPGDHPARREFETYMQTALDQPGGLYRAAQDAFNRGDPARAVPMLKTAMQWDPLSPQIPEVLGFVHNALGQPWEAARALERAAELAPDNPQTPLYAALAWSEAGDLQRAETMLGEALRRDRTLARAWYNLGLLQARTGRPKEAIVSLREAARLEPRDADAPYALATVYLQLGRSEEARLAARRALEIEPGRQDARQLLQSLEAGGQP